MNPLLNCPQLIREVVAVMSFTHQRGLTFWKDFKNYPRHRGK